MGNILNNPKEFFNNLSSEEFEQLLKDFGFRYEDIKNLTEKKRKLILRK